MSSQLRKPLTRLLKIGTHFKIKIIYGSVFNKPLITCLLHWPLLNIVLL